MDNSNMRIISRIASLTDEEIKAEFEQWLEIDRRRVYRILLEMKHDNKMG